MRGENHNSPSQTLITSHIGFGKGLLEFVYIQSLIYDSICFFYDYYMILFDKNALLDLLKLLFENLSEFMSLS
jgi:hypothetical protein